MLLVSEMQNKKKIGSDRVRFRDKLVENFNYTDFLKKKSGARNSTRGLKLKISKASPSTEADDLNHAHNEG